MVMILEKGKVCPYANDCPHNRSTNLLGKCYGARSDRNNEFFCEFVEDGKIKLDGVKTPKDKTGKMKVLME